MKLPLSFMGKRIRIHSTYFSFLFVLCLLPAPLLSFTAIQLLYCWRALARQLPILYNSEKKAKSVGCKIEDMRSRLCFLYPGIPGCL